MSFNILIGQYGFMIMETKTKILQKSFELFVVKGFTDVSIDDITKAVGVTKGAFYYHYKSKDELLVDVISKYVFLHLDGTMTIIQKSSGTAREKIERFFTVIADLEAEFKKLTEGVIIDFRSFFLLVMEGVKKLPPIAERYAQFHDGMRQKVKEILDEGKLYGDVPTSINSDTISYLLLGCTQGLMLQWVVKPEINIKELMRDSCDFIWHGITL